MAKRTHTAHTKKENNKCQSKDRNMKQQYVRPINESNEKKELCSAYGTKRRNGKGRDYIENSCNCFVASNHMVMHTGNIQRAKKNEIK